MHKKSDYYTGATNYKDLDGNMKTFTYVDHDIKSNLSFDTISEEEYIQIKENARIYKEECIKEILALPAISLAGYNDNAYEQFIIRDLEKGIIWNEEVVRNALSINDDLRRSLHLFVWRSTVKESNWFHPMREDHEAIVRGDWKTLI